MAGGKKQTRKKGSGSNSQRHTDENEDVHPIPPQDQMLTVSRRAGGVWFNNDKVRALVRDSIEANYTAYFPNWTTMPRERQEHMFNYFKARVKTDDAAELEEGYDLAVKKPFRDFVYRAAQKKKPPKWMPPACFNVLKTRKEKDPAFAEKSKKATENRCKGGKDGKALPTHVLSRRSGGAALEAAATGIQDFTPFKMLEMSKKNKEGKWITPRAEQIAKNYLEEAAAHENDNFDPNELYLQSAGGFDRKGRVYDTCEEAPNFFTPPKAHNRSSSRGAPSYTPGVVSQTAAQNKALMAKVQELDENQKLMMEFMRQNLNWTTPTSTCSPGPSAFRRDDFSDDHGDGHGFSSLVPPT